MNFRHWLKVTKSLIFSCLMFYSLAISAREIQLVSSDYPPFRGANLPHQGMLNEIVKKALALEGHTTEVTFYPWARAMYTAEKGEKDGMIGVWHTPERAEKFIFSDPITPNKMIFYKRRDSDFKLSTLSSLKLKGLVIGGVLGYAYPKGIQESGAKISSVSDESQNFKLLSKERVDLIIVDQDFAAYYLNQPQNLRYLRVIEPVMPILETRQQHLAVSRAIENPDQIIKAFNQGLNKLIESGELQRIIDSHLLKSSD